MLWEDNRSKTYDIYGQLVSPAGTLDGNNYLVVGETQNENRPRLTLDGNGGALAVWQRDNGGTAANDLYGRWLGSDGLPVGEGFAILEADDEQQRPAVAGDGAGGYLLSWQDDRNGNWDVYGSRFAPLQAGFTATPTVGFVSLQVEFTDESAPAGAADEWLWTFGDGMTSTLASPVHTYTVPGAYTVTQWVTDTATGEWDVLTRSHYIVVLSMITIAYDYDPLYRLITATYSSAEVYTYTYDQVGNRLAMGADGELITYTYDEANRLTWVDDVEYTWDDNGNLLNNGVFSYTYDYANRLVRVEDVTTTLVYTYNGDGHRVAKAVDSVTTTYVVAVLGLSQVLMETAGGESIFYLYGHDLLAEESSSGWAWHLGDGLGSVRQLTDDSGQVTLAQGYTPFGVLLWSAGSAASGYGFTGEQHDPSAGLYYLRARYYDPATGRFLTRDPFPGFTFDPISQHPYVYARNSPVNWIDPIGLQGGLTGWLEDLIRAYIFTASSMVPSSLSELVKEGLLYDATVAFRNQVDAAKYTVVVPEPSRLVPRITGAVAGGLFNALFQSIQDLNLCLTPGQRLGRAGIAGLEGFGATLIIGVTLSAIGLAGAPAFVVGLGIGLGVSAGMNWVNERLLFPKLGLAP